LSAEFTITGRYAYGLMTGERGTHRLVRISPFDNQGRRQTSFAAVQVWPVMDAPDVELNESDIEMQVFRASRKSQDSNWAGACSPASARTILMKTS
jgi:peptide chain release factor 2